MELLLAVKQKRSASLFNQSQACFKVGQGLETWHACSLPLLALACQQAHGFLQYDEFMQPDALSSENAHAVTCVAIFILLDFLGASP